MFAVLVEQSHCPILCVENTGQAVTFSKKSITCAGETK